MPDQGRLIELRFPAQASRLRLLRSVVRDAAEFSGCSPGECDRVVVAVNEACMNVIQHAYAHDPAGEIILEILNNDGRLVFRLMDFAPPVDASTVKPRDLDDVRPGGLGTHLIREVMDEAGFLPPPPGVGNLFQMAKNIK